MRNVLRVYLDPAEIGADGYPHEWHAQIKDMVRRKAGGRCERCGHPYLKGSRPRGEWTPCDGHCTHGGPIRFAQRYRRGGGHGAWVSMGRGDLGEITIRTLVEDRQAVEAQWRILTVHHLNGVKHDCRWWNLAALCQRCHLQIQARVVMDRVWPWEHSEWFKPHAAGWYAAAYLGEELTRRETLARLDELLSLEAAA